MQQIPPPPPGFVLQGGGAAPPSQPRQPQGNPSLPRGLRNNNPGNIEDGPFARSLPGYAGSDGRFAIFDNPNAGNQAKTRLLGSYVQRGFNTPMSIINRWAPPSDNNPTQAYAQYVAQRAGIGPNDTVTPDMIPTIAQAISEFENGQTRRGSRIPGNIDLNNRPVVKNRDGTISTVRSMSFGTDQGEVLIPTVSDDGRLLGEEEAIRQYEATGRHLGIFSTPQEATAYAKQLHDQQSQQYAPPPPEGFVIEGADTLAPVANEQNVERAGMRTIDGKTQLWDAASQSYVDATPEQIAEYEANLRRGQQDRIARAERMADPQYQLAMADAQRGSENVPDALRAVSLGQTLGFTDEINALAQGGLQAIENAGNRLSGQPVRYSAEYAAQAARDAERDAAARYAAEKPLTNFGLQLAGGLVTPGIMGAGQYISAAQGSARLGRAAQVGAGYGAASGFGNATGDIAERAPDAALGAAVGAGVGAIGQRTVDRLMAPQAARPASAARRLSREGVQLTPGQMLSETPVIGPVARTLEEAASTIPFVGGAVAGARDRSIDTFNRAAINRVLKPLGETMPTGLRSQIARIGRGEENPQSGFEAVGRVQDIVRRSYDRALEGVEVRPDQQFYDDLAQVAVNVAEEVPEPMVAQYTNILQNRVFRTLEERDSILTGQNFKRAESELGMIASEQRMSLDPANKALARALDDSRTVLRDLIARQRPDRAPQIQAVNRAYSNLVPIEEAAGAAASEAREGVFTPTTLSQFSRRNQTRSTRAAGEGRMQDLTASGRAVLNSRIGDSGTATRGAVTALASGAAGAGSVMNPAVAVPTIIGVSLAYSRPAQALLNAAYQAADSQTANLALQELAVLAQRNPALVPYYQDAVSFVRGLALPDTQAAPPARSSAQAPSAALQRVMQ